MRNGPLRSNDGFSLVELLVAMGLTMTLVGGALLAFDGVRRATEGADLRADVNQSVRAGLNLLTRDLLAAGQGIPTGGIPVPSGAGSTPIVRPSPAGTSLTFPVADTLPAVSTGAGLGPAIRRPGAAANAPAGASTDMVTVLMADSTLPSLPLTSVSADGSTVIVDASIPLDDPASGVTAGDLMMLSNARGNTLQMVTGRTGQAIAFEAGDSLSLNQRGAAQGTILQLQSGPGVYPPTTARRILMISYYVDATTDAERPRLVRRINNRPERAVCIGVEALTFSYDLVDGATNPINVRTPTAPNTPHQIRKANIFLAARSSTPWGWTNEPIRSGLSAQVSLRSLSFVDRYR